MRKVFLSMMLLFFTFLVSCSKEVMGNIAQQEERGALLERLRGIMVANGVDPARLTLQDTLTKDQIALMYSRIGEFEDFIKAHKDTTYINLNEEAEFIDLTEEEEELLRKMMYKNPVENSIEFILKRRDSIASKQLNNDLTNTSGKSARFIDQFLVDPTPTKYNFMIQRTYKKFSDMDRNNLIVHGLYTYNESSKIFIPGYVDSVMTGIMLGKRYTHRWGDMSLYKQYIYGEKERPGVYFKGAGKFEITIFPEFAGALYSDLVSFYGYYVPGGYDSMEVSRNKNIEN
ncbi:hypothetical protein [Capnocytophaga cynodegmi]|uniref:Lipoprotein n=1 Tax=Capnocytophaga cynodegmi TaxID=28189 RepID=A0A0B7HV87_9FLAO|nr:hypothetical protein [Capnocytophaga cynodegmi]CEN34410.1 exported hypothetical protein [Capnocytophaga cynodegmi]CEN41807.1 exported hypothetical protein [Capnocytophaga cynodegmi]